MTKNPITRNTFRYCRVRFCWTTLETAVNIIFRHCSISDLRQASPAHFPLKDLKQKREKKAQLKLNFLKTERKQGNAHTKGIQRKK